MTDSIPISEEQYKRLKRSLDHLRHLISTALSRMDEAPAVARPSAMPVARQSPPRNQTVDKPLKKSIQTAIEQKRFGFRGGWVSSEAVRVLMPDPVHGPSLSRVMWFLGYEFAYRVRAANGRVRLYCVRSCDGLTGPEILVAFEEDQAAHMPEPTSATIRMPEPTSEPNPWRTLQ